MYYQVTLGDGKPTVCIDCSWVRIYHLLRISTEPIICNGCGLEVNTLAARIWFRDDLGHLEGPIQVCARCSPGGTATYWTRDLEAHIVSD
jgi:hypothetical protein